MCPPVDAAMLIPRLQTPCCNTVTHAQIPVFGNGSPIVAEGVEGGTVDESVIDVEGGGEGRHQEEVGKIEACLLSYHTQQASTRPPVSLSNTHRLLIRANDDHRLQDYIIR